MDKYRPCPSIIAMFSSDSQHPPRSKHAVYLGVYVYFFVTDVKRILEMGLDARKPVFSVCKQQRCIRGLISAFVIHYLKRIISKLATSDFSVFWLVSVAEETGLSNALADTPVLSHRGPNNINEPRHEISNNVVCATSKGSDQPAHRRRLLRAFASRLNFL